MQAVHVHVEELHSGSLSLMAASAGALWRRDSIVLSFSRD